MHTFTPQKSTIKEKLNKLHSRKELLKEKYKCDPSQNNLFKILNTLKDIDTFELKLENKAKFYNK